MEHTNLAIAEIDVLKERNTLGHALLHAAASLSQLESADAILQEVCVLLSTSSDHIRLAWMIPKDLNADTLKPNFAAGAAKEYGYSLIFTPNQSYGPLRKAIKDWHPVTGNISTDNIFSEVRERAAAHKLLSTVCIPIGKKNSKSESIIALYADQHDYFEIIGLDLFTAFAHVVGAAIEQISLLNNLSYMANHDQLTNILNRRGLQDRLKAELSLYKRYDRIFSIILFDLDRFKLINDGLGHSYGDQVLNQIATLFNRAIRDEDVLGRWGGEEFLCILPELDHEAAGQFAERMRTILTDTPLHVGNQTLHITASFGYASCPADEDDIESLVASADAALYQAKYSGRNRSIGASDNYVRIHAIGSQLDLALRENRVVPAYQPIVDLKTGEVVAEETLARMVDHDGKIIEAGHFIEAASQLHLLHRIDHTIMSQAFQHCVTGLSQGRTLKHFVNISGDLMRHQDLVQSLLTEAQNQCQQCNGLISENKPMVIEITERELLNDIGAVRELLAPFIDFGFTLALDDFGSGYSSYHYLVDLPISILKIDGELIRKLPDPRARAVIQGIQNTASSLGITTVAEYIEDAQTAELLKEIGIDLGQGFYYGRPQLANH
ncbi:MAG: bifunctional diguanylate cyclase/phosphodiesterase [Gammaproteobacteria bacterium]|nr:bifunctional diguanylate cyclase/phosphodiesterase [Gammaproteobacteria bacterium]